MYELSDFEKIDEENYKNTLFTKQLFLFAPLKEKNGLLHYYCHNNYYYYHYYYYFEVLLGLTSERQIFFLVPRFVYI